MTQDAESVSVPPDFERAAVAMFRYQSVHCIVYRDFLAALGWDHSRCSSVSTWDEVCSAPFLPVEAFKSRTVQTGDFQPEVVFTSSGTTGQQPSKHGVASLQAYLVNAQHAFEQAYGPVSEYAWLCLLPGYTERSGSSLVAMAEHFVQQSPHPESGFFLREPLDLLKALTALEKRKQPTVLLGVTFALLDFCEWLPFPLDVRHTLVMETGGMKGRRAEPTRAQVHATIQQALGVAQVHSEYGMTELMSQAYAQRDGLYTPSITLAVLPRNPDNPLERGELRRTCGLNVVDLANVHSCGFLALQDVGRVYPDGVFEVLGRFDAAEVRGCSLMS